MTLVLAALLTALLSLAAAAPTPSPFHSTLSDFRRYLSSGVSDEAPFPLADSSPFAEPVYFSQAAFCDPHPGDVIRGSKVVWRGGNGQDLPTIFIAYSDEKGIIISNQGTNVSDARSIEIDLRLDLVDASKRFAGCLDAHADVHRGFQGTWERTADAVYEQVQSLLQNHPDAPILFTGHSLGAALSTLGYAYFRCRLPDARISAVVYGPPRVGDVPFANSIDRLARGHPFTYVVNGRDDVPHLPPRAPTKNSPGYWHSSGQIWINPGDSLNAVVCPGQENKHCSGQYTLLSETKHSDHSGLYFGVEIYGQADEIGCRVVERHG